MEKMDSIHCYFLGTILFSILFMPTFTHGLTMTEIKDLRAKHRLSCLLVFGDSSVDSGNNNCLTTVMKSNFLPYGKDFIGGHPTGRFSNGKLATDFFSEALGFGRIVPAFLDPNLTKADLLHSVNFASAGSGYDELTSNLTNSISLNKQINYLKHYKLHLRKNVGRKKADDIVSKAVVVMSTGINDYLVNYFVEPTRAKQFTLDEYQDYLISSLRHAVKEMHKVGVRRITLAGLIPAGCVPIVITLQGDGLHCVEKVNDAVISLNHKIQKELKSFESTLKTKTFYIDVYGSVYNAINNPKRYGFTETSKGCVGTGTYELADACKGLSVCKDPNKYIFWDAVHCTQMMYKIVSNQLVTSIPSSFFM